MADWFTSTVGAARWPKIWPYLLGGTLVSVFFVGMLYLHHVAQLNQRETLLQGISRDYSLNPFGWLDAEMYCQRRTEMRYGDNLGQTYVDRHSTRIDPDTGVYKMFMVAQVGTPGNYERTSVHCFVDPERQMLTHYRVVSMDPQTLMSRAVRFFGI